MDYKKSITYIKLLGNGEAFVSYDDGTYENVDVNQIVSTDFKCEKCSK